MNYFELYGISESMTIDDDYLKRRFLELSKQKQITGFTDVNSKAYQTLSDPYKRIKYILELHHQLAENEQYQLPGDFLKDMTEINESLEELEDDFEYSTFNGILAQLNLLDYAIKEELIRLTRSFDEKTDADQKSILLAIKDLWYRQKYLLRIRDSLNRFASR